MSSEWHYNDLAVVKFDGRLSSALASVEYNRNDGRDSCRSGKS